MNAPTRAPESTALTTTTDQIMYRAPALTGRDLILQPDNLNAMVRVSQLMAKSGQAVPKVLRNNEGACFAVTSQAMRWNMDPFALAQKAYTASDDSPIAYEGQAIIAALNNSPLLATRLSFEWHGPWEKIIGKFVWKTAPARPAEHGKPAKKETKYLAKDWKDEDEAGLYIIVRATLVGEAAPRELQLYLMQARTRNSPLWTEDPKQQLAYLAGRRWGRLHAPDVIMGVYTPDELQEFEPKDMGPADVVTPQVSPALLKAARDAADKGRAAFSDWWAKALPPERSLLSGEVADLKARVESFEGQRTVENQPRQDGAGPVAQDQAAGAAATTASDAPAFVATYASVLDKMVKAGDKKDADALDIAADWIGEIADETQRRELAAKYEQIKAEITGGAAQ